MKKSSSSIIDGLNELFNSKVKVGIMAILVVNDWVDFKSLKELLDLSDGNLASHVKALEANNCIQVKKEFVGKKPRTSYKCTLEGRQAFQDHLNALEELLNHQAIRLKK